MKLEDLLIEPLQFPRRDEVDSLVQEAMQCLPANRADLSSRVSHAIRTPLAAILGFREVLDMDHAISDEDRALYAEIVEGETHRLRRFVESLRVFRALLAGELKNYRTTQDIRTTVQTAVSHCSMDAKTKKVRVEVIDGSEELLILADHQRLCLSIEHLLLNSLRATSAEGIVDIEIVDRKEHVAIVVEDSGYGLDVEQTDVLFKPFQRIPRPDDNGGELGIGLTLVRSIVERHEGTVSVDSVPMEGCRITLTIPH